MRMTAERFEERRSGIGGSDVAAILGLSPWHTPLEVYLEKIGEAGPRPDNAAMYWGRVLEDVVAAEYARRTGSKLRRVNRLLRHRRHPIAIASLDREIVAHKDGPGVLEVKTVGRHTDEWGEPGSDDIPPWYCAQVMHYMAVTGRAWADIAVLFLADREFATYRVLRDGDLIAQMLDEETRWWREHVEARVPPPPRSLEEARRLWPRAAEGKIAMADLSSEGCAAELARVRDQIKKLERMEERLVLDLQSAMGDAERLETASGKLLATWQTVHTRRLDITALRKAHPAIAEQFEHEGVIRKFMLKLKPEE